MAKPMTYFKRVKILIITHDLGGHDVLRVYRYRSVRNLYAGKDYQVYRAQNL